MPPRALQITELVSLICEYSSPCSQANLAQTCTFIAEPALDALWADQMSISDLLVSVLPENTITFTTHDRYLLMEPFCPEQGHVAVEPTDAQWDRVASYGARMKTVGVSSYLRPWSPHNVHFSRGLIGKWMEYAQRRGIGPALCPNAKYAEWNIVEPSKMAHELAFALNAGLLSLTLYISDMTDQLLPVFFSVLPAMTSSTLRRLEMDDKELEPIALVWDIWLSLMIVQCPALEYVSLSAASAESIRALASLTALHTLRLRDVINIGECDANVRSFPVLATLTVTNTELDQIIALLRMLEGHGNLTDVDFMCWPTQNDVAQQLTLMFGLVARSCNTASLSSFELRDISQVTLDGENPLYTISCQSLRPLLVFRGLQSVIIELRGHIDLDDDDVEVLAQSWPLLQHLQLAHTGFLSIHELRWPSDIPRPSPDRIRTTPRCLLSLASHCPHLATVCIPFDLSVLPKVTRGRPGGGIVQSVLGVLCVGPMMGFELESEETTTALAIFLSDVFPSLQNIYSAYALVAPARDKFDKLLKLVCALAIARQQERAWLVEHQDRSHT
ncbi:hypothetical protein BD626DRAFT_565028 [Schizophyllum amplum]|uniref:F-box domain-containing protein n=1 Tax=Schizophyllum amplum TaxID=97359 RepID=A0A550CTR2_9AGAR|nr:hypothetical protein BD626DRAFT_565028 [Auriculariopsis ampla]